LPSVADTCDWLISSSFSGSAPVFRRFARRWADSIVKPPEISDPLDASMPSGLRWKSMYGTEIRSWSRRIAKCWKADCGSWPGTCCAAPRWARDLLPDLLAVVGEVERDVRRRELVEVLLGVLDVGAAQDRIVVEHVPLVGLLLGLVGLLGPDDDRALVDLRDLELRVGDAERAVRRLAQRRLAVGLQRRQRLLGTADDRLLLLGDAVVLARVRVQRVFVRRPLGGDLQRLEQRTGGGTGAGRPIARHVGVGRVRQAVVAEDVLLPVVEEHLGDLADLALGFGRVLDVRQVDVDLVGSGAQDLRLRDAELVDALAHDVQRALERVAGDLGGELGRLGLVDEADAALEIQALAGLLRHDDDGARDEQTRYEQQDEEVASAVGHGAGAVGGYLAGVRTSRSPPSSS
jgi:hypothetical protein